MNLLSVTRILSILAAGSAIAALFCYVISKLGLKHSWFSKDSFRRPIGEAVPLFGGVGIVLSLILVNIFIRDSLVWQIVISALPFFILGVYDDFREVSSKLKFGAQLLAALTWVLLTGADAVLYTRLGLPPAMGAAVTILFIVTLANAINFLDGVDGQAGVAIICALAALGFAYEPVFPAALVLISAILGFLILNFPPAKIYMGEVGSSFLGFAAAAIATLLPIGNDQLSTFMAVNFIFSLAFCDIIYVVFRRLRMGLSPWSPDKQHFHHKLRSIGLSSKVILFVTSLIFVVSCLTGYRLQTSDSQIGNIVLTLISGSCLTFIYMGIHYAEAMWGHRISAFGRKLIEKYVPLDLIQIKIEEDYKCVMIDILTYFTEIQSRGIADVDRFARDFGWWAQSLENVKSVKLVGSYSVVIIFEVEAENLFSWKSSILKDLHKIFAAHRALRTYKEHPDGIYFYDSLYDQEINRILQISAKEDVDMKLKITG